jgi:hypothetical protein
MRREGYGYKLSKALGFSLSSCCVFSSPILQKNTRKISFLIMATATKNLEALTVAPKLSIDAEEVRETVELEHALTFQEALSFYPKAIGWSFYFSLGVIMLGTVGMI